MVDVWIKFWLLLVLFCILYHLQLPGEKIVRTVYGSRSASEAVKLVLSGRGRGRGRERGRGRADLSNAHASSSGTTSSTAAREKRRE